MTADVMVAEMVTTTTVTMVVICISRYDGVSVDKYQLLYIHNHVKRTITKDVECWHSPKGIIKAVDYAIFNCKAHLW